MSAHSTTRHTMRTPASVWEVRSRHVLAVSVLWEGDVCDVEDRGFRAALSI